MRVLRTAPRFSRGRTHQLWRHPSRACRDRGGTLPRHHPSARLGGGSPSGSLIAGEPLAGTVRTAYAVGIVARLFPGNAFPGRIIADRDRPASQRVSRGRSIGPVRLAVASLAVPPDTGSIGPDRPKVKKHAWPCCMKTSSRARAMRPTARAPGRTWSGECPVRQVSKIGEFAQHLARAQGRISASQPIPAA